MVITRRLNKCHSALKFLAAKIQAWSMFGRVGYSNNLFLKGMTLDAKTDSSQTHFNKGLLVCKTWLAYPYLNWISHRENIKTNIRKLLIPGTWPHDHLNPFRKKVKCHLPENIFDSFGTHINVAHNVTDVPVKLYKKFKFCAYHTRLQILPF